MKPYIYVVSIGILLSTASVYPLLQRRTSQKEYDAMLRIITGAHTRTFSNENLLTQRLKSEDKRVWHATLLEVYNFLDKKNSELHAYMDRICAASSMLTNSISTLFGKHIAHALINPDDRSTGTTRIHAATINPNALSTAELNAHSARLRQYHTDMIELYNQLHATNIGLSTRRSQGITVAQRLALTLECTYDKAIHDFDTLQTRLPLAA